MRLLPVVLTLAALLPASLHAQRWSAEQQSVIDGIKECWDIWMDGVEGGTPETFIDQCQLDDTSFWITTDGAPNTGTDFLRNGWGAEVGIDLAWLDLRPLVVSIHDDVAVVHFYGYWRMPGPVAEEAKRTEVWRREDGRWKLWAGNLTVVG